MDERLLIFVFACMAVTVAFFSGIYYGRWQHMDTAWVLLPIAGFPVAITLLAMVGVFLGLGGNRRA